MDYLQDDVISFKAKGIMAYIIKHQIKPGSITEIVFSLDALPGSDGSTSIRSGIKELVTMGYLKKQLHRDEKGRVVGYRWFIKINKE